MQLNVLDDLAEAMKALDGKKQSRYICHHSGRKGGQQEQPGGRAVPIRRLGGFVGKPISYQGLSANTRLERTDDSKKGDMETDPIQPLGRKPANDPTRRVEQPTGWKLGRADSEWESSNLKPDIPPIVEKECCAEWVVKCMSSFEFVETGMSHRLIVF